MEHMYTATYHDLVYTEGYLPEVAAGMTADRLNRTLLGTDGIYNIYDKDINSLFDSNGKIVPGAKMKWNENWLKEAQAKCPVRQEYQFSINGSGKNSKYLASLSYLDEDGTYTTKEDVALYIHLYGELPLNFMTKKHARALGWEGGSLEPVAPGMCIGGDHFGNYEGLLPEDREYTECDIDTLGAKSRGAKRIVFSDDGLIYYTEDHYESFELLYGEP